MKTGHFPRPKNLWLLGFLALALTACTQSGGTSTALTTAGLVDTASFPGAVHEARVVQGGLVVATSPVASDGRFELSVPGGTGYRLELVYDGGVATLVFPRRAGGVDSSFDVMGSFSFDLGSIRYIGDPSEQQFSFKSSTGDGADDDDIECEDGIDPSTGEICIDDDDDEGAGTCEEDGEDGEVDAEDGDGEDGEADAEDGDGEDDEEDAEDEDPDGIECEDGIDPATGLECDGGPSADDDGEDDEADEEEDEDDMPSDAAVADHNLPGTVGCPGEEEDGDNVECEDGIDPATGAWCDGGPDANRD